MALVVHNKGRRTSKKGKSLLKAKILKGKFLPRLEFPEEWGVLNNKLSRRKGGTCIICFNWEMYITNPTWISTRIITHWLWHHFTSIWWCYILRRIWIEVFFRYNSFNINKCCIISLTYKELLSFPFASSISTPSILMESEHKNTCNTPFALRCHVTSFLRKWKLYDFAFKKPLVGHTAVILKQNNSDLVFQTRTIFLKIMSQFIAGLVTKTWFLKLWITSFWTKILHLNFKEIVEKMMW